MLGSTSVTIAIYDVRFTDTSVCCAPISLKKSASLRFGWKKIHAIVNSRGRPIALEVTPGQLGDVRVALALISAVPPGRRLAGDAAYDSDGLRRLLIERGTLPVIPNNPTRKRPHPFDEDAYRHRNLIERMFCRLKDRRRIATRYDKLASSFAAAVAIAAVIIWWA